MIKVLINLAEKGFLPDLLIRLGIKRLCGQRLSEANTLGLEALENSHQQWIDLLTESPVAIVPEKANEQHYEVPPKFFELVLGANLKYSSGYWSKEVFSLDESELEMLKITCERAGLIDGQDILELGCGWGSLTCFMAQKFPNSKITAVSNSKDQRNFIQQKNDKLNLQNIKVFTADMNDFSTDEKFDRVISIEMFEHMRNYDELLKRIDGWLKQNGKLFVHIFSHKEVAYPFEDKGDGDWMAREFFSGGQMPSHRLLMSFPDRMKIEKDWRVSGTHYEKTSLAWLRKMDTNKIEVLELFKTTYGEKDASEWFQRWRIFFMSCEVLFGFNEGSEWGVSHYLFEKP
ncbi:cyclopropane-fatty-acyl-phospholipid synthase family protein [Candidatus Thioglobus sp.]|nr:cyclopropane-fatty-acyl-phospholipid synthase family protein [Candidatus Thioglobus sp.]